jgi:hypothetical protein
VTDNYLHPVIILVHTITSRLGYITDFIGQQLFGEKPQLTTNIAEFQQHRGPRINYTAEPVNGSDIWIVPHSLLFENGIHIQSLDVFSFEGRKAFFKTGGDWPFDLFAASFYLLSRYEEYLPHTKDMYGRYAHENSVAWKEGFLNIPLVNFWLADVRKLLERKGYELPPSKFAFLPTYDIDEAYSYRHKGFARSAGGVIKAALKGDFEDVGNRFSVVKGRQQDPFDSYDWMDALHERYGLAPIYFFLVANEKGKNDKNISPRRQAMHELIRRHAEKYTIGIHPSWQSGDNPSLIDQELSLLEQISGREIVYSRQHFIRLTIPSTYRLLAASGVKKEFSMGYGSINGFRASVAAPFNWYDLEREEITSLVIFPFCYMEANSFFEQKKTASEALEEMRHYYSVIKEAGGVFISIWHNTFLGTAHLYKGWREAYQMFLEECSISNK